MPPLKRKKADPLHSVRKLASRSSRLAKKTTLPTQRNRQAAPGKKPLLAVDGDFFVHRAYHGLPKTILTKDGKPAGAILGFANTLLRLYAITAPRAVMVAWDTLDVPTYRHKSFPDYQSGRVFDSALVQQFEFVRCFVSACGFQNARAPGFEADDFLAAAARRQERRGDRTMVASGDRDTFQLASAATNILFPAKGGEWLRIGPDEVVARYGVAPNQVPDFIALRGDPSDRIPGAQGVGAESAAAILRRNGSLDAAIKAGLFRNQAEKLRLFRAIATMDDRAPLPPLRSQNPKWNAAAELASEWGLNQLSRRLKGLADEAPKP